MVRLEVARSNEKEKSMVSDPLRPFLHSLSVGPIPPLLILESFNAHSRRVLSVECTIVSYIALLSVARIPIFLCALL